MPFFPYLGFIFLSRVCSWGDDCNHHLLPAFSRRYHRALAPLSNTFTPYLPGARTLTSWSVTSTSTASWHRLIPVFVPWLALAGFGQVLRRFNHSSSAKVQITAWPGASHSSSMFPYSQASAFLALTFLVFGCKTGSQPVRAHHVGIMEGHLEEVPSFSRDVLVPNWFPGLVPLKL